MKKTIYTLNIGDYAPEITNLTYPYIKKYAEKIGANFKIMPTKEQLEDFIKGLEGKGDGTYFDSEKGIFVNPSVKKK